MPRNFKLLVLLLILVISVALICSCNSGKNGPDTSAPVETGDTVGTSEEDVNEVPDEPDAERKIRIEAINGKINYKVIRPNADKLTDVSVESAKMISQKLGEILDSTSAPMGNDYSIEGNENACEILVGDTAYAETAEAAAKCGYGDYIIDVIGNKIVIFAYLDEALELAAEQFIYTVSRYESEEDGELVINIDESDVSASGTCINTISNIPVLDGGTFYAYYDAGQRTASEETRCDEVVISNVTVELFTAYLEKVEASGFDKIAENDLSGNLFATYTTSRLTLNVGYYKHDSTARLMIEGKTPSLPEQTQYTAVTTSSISMLGTEYTKSDGSISANGLSMIIRLEDGRFVIIDGGRGRQKNLDAFMTELTELSKEYTDKPVIAAWIITHAHGDHNDFLNKYYTQIKQKGIVVEDVIANFMSDTERARSHAAYPDDFSENEGNPADTYKAVSALNATVYKAHVGQEYYYADMKIDVLYTLETLAPTTIQALNTSSLILRMTFTGGGKTTVFMLPGDATGHSMRVCAEMYGDDLKSDIVQVAHHGYSTWGDDEGTILAYKNINATLVLWPQGLSAFPKYRTKAYNAVLFGLPAYKDCRISGAEGDVTRIPLHYVYGETDIKCNCVSGCKEPHNYKK